MSARYTVAPQIAGNLQDPVSGSMLATCHLSDGTVVFLTTSSVVGSASPQVIPTGHASVWYSTNHRTALLAATIDYSENVYTALLEHACNWTICRDASDNIYVLVARAEQLRTWGLTKGAGYAWTVQAAGRFDLHASATGDNGVAAVWCSTGGGTNTAGHVMAVWCDSQAANFSGYSIIDAGLMLTTGANAAVNTSTNPTFLGTSTTNGKTVLDIEPDGFGVADGIAAVWHTASTLAIGRWAVNAAGALSTNTNITIAQATGTMTAATCKVRVVRTASNVFAVLFLDSGGVKVTCARYSKTALLTAAATYGTVTGFGASGNSFVWDASYDSVGSKLWLYGPSSITPDTMLRLGCTVSAGITWDSVAVTDDTNVAGYFTGGQYLSAIRCVKDQITAAKGADWQADANDGAGGKQVVGDFTAYDVTPSAPTLTGPTAGAYIDLARAQTFAWSPNFPSISDTQYAYAMRKKNAVAAKTITTVAVTSNVATITTSTAHGLVVGDIITNSGLAHAALNITVAVASLPTTTTFTFAVVTANVVSVADAGTETPAYGYWNGTNFATTSAVWNLGSTPAAVIPTSVFGSNGNSYVWSAATQELTSLIQGAFATDFSLLTYPAPVVVVTAPTGVITTTTLPTVTWTYTQTQGLPQASYRVLIYDTTVVPVPNPGVDGLQSWDSGTIYTAALTATPTTPLTNAHNFTSYVYATTRLGGASGWASLTFSLNVTVPTTPTLTASYDATTARTTLTGTGTAAGGFTFANTTMLFQYTDDAGVTWTNVRSSTAVAPNSSFIGVAYDYEGIPGAARGYRVIVVGTTGTVYSLASTTQNATAAPTAWWIKDPTTPAYNMTVRSITEGDVGRRISRGVFDVLGASNVLVVKDTRKAVDLTLEVHTSTAADHTNLAAMLNTEHTLLVQSPSSVGVSRYIEPGDTTESRLTTMRVDYWVWKIPYDEVARP